MLLIIHATHRIGMYLAGILGLCALLHFPPPVGDSGAAVERFAQTSDAAPQSSQQPPVGSDQAGQPANPSDAASAPSNPPATPKKPAPRKKRTAHKKPSAPAQDSSKTVIRKGGTGDPTLQLTPTVTDEEASRERETTKQLLSSTDANLQKLSTRQLSKEEQDTVTQIKVFMDQAKTADSKGDLERASKLAAKAHLLSEALNKP
jgi:hypothetical protein